jgi:putative peptide zinc metalloprotease protein
VVWPAEASQLRAGQAGFAQQYPVEPSSNVDTDQALILLQDEALTTEQHRTEIRLQELEIRAAGVIGSDRVEASILQDEISTLRDDLAILRQRVASLTVLSPAHGVFVSLDDNLPGQFVRQGQLLGYVVANGDLTVRVMVSQAEVSRIASNTRRVEVRLASKISETIPAILARDIPQGSRRLPSKVLTVEGGGKIASESDPNGNLLALDQHFQLELSLPNGSTDGFIGTRVFVRFDHGLEPLWRQCYRSLRQLFLRGFHV